MKFYLGAEAAGELHRKQPRGRSFLDFLLILIVSVPCLSMVAAETGIKEQAMLLRLFLGPPKKSLNS